jgi:hypothetical protein
MRERKRPDRRILEGTPNRQVEEPGLALRIQVYRAGTNPGERGDLADLGTCKAMLDKDFGCCVRDLVEAVVGSFAWHG